MDNIALNINGELSWMDIEQFKVIDPTAEANGPRRSGKSTRLINQYIEYLMKGNTVIVISEYFNEDGTPNSAAAKHMLCVIENRMKNEFKRIKLSINHWKSFPVICIL